jgi:hypothetical protein
VLFASAGAGHASAQTALLSSSGAMIEHALREGEQAYDIAERRYVLGERLAEDRDARHTFNPKAGTTYLGIALCEEACSDIDLLVEDATGNVLDNDETDGAEPMLLFRAERTGPIRVVISMRECGEDACEHGLGFHTLRGKKP